MLTLSFRQSFLSVMGTCSPEKNEDDARLEQLFSAPSPVHRNRNKVVSCLLVFFFCFVSFLDRPTRLHPAPLLMDLVV